MGGDRAAHDEGAAVVGNMGGNVAAVGGAPERPDLPRLDRQCRPPRSPVRQGQSPPASPRLRAQRPLLELVVVPRTPAIQVAEDALSLALLALVVGTRPAVTPAMVLAHLVGRYGVMEDHVTVRRSRPDDFLVRFRRREDLELVLSSPAPPGAPFVLRWRRWSRLILGSAGAFRYRVLVGLKGIPSHAHSKETAQIILGSSCINVDIANPEAVADPEDERELFVAAWCAHPDLVTDEKIMAVPEPEEEHDGGLRPHEIIHGEVPSLRYLVRLRLIEYQDWHTPPPSSDDEMFYGGESSDSGDSNYNGYHPGFGGGGGGARPRTTRFGGNGDPRLGRGSGPAFHARESRCAIVVGDVTCPIPPRGTMPCRTGVSMHAVQASRGRVSASAVVAPTPSTFARAARCSPTVVIWASWLLP